MSLIHLAVVGWCAPRGLRHNLGLSVWIPWDKVLSANTSWFRQWRGPWEGSRAVIQGSKGRQWRAHYQAKHQATSSYVLGTLHIIPQIKPPKKDVYWLRAAPGAMNFLAVLTWHKGVRNRFQCQEKIHRQRKAGSSSWMRGWWPLKWHRWGDVGRAPAVSLLQVLRHFWNILQMLKTEEVINDNT